MFLKLNVSIIDCKGTNYYFMIKGIRVNMPDNITNCDQERLEKKVRRIGF